MDKKIDLIAKLFITYIFILALCFLLYSLVVIPTDGAEKVNAIIGLLGWSATIYAPIAAYFFVDNWKDQTKYNEILKILASLINEITTLSNHITDLRSNNNLALFIDLSIQYITKTEIPIGEAKILIDEAAKEFPLPNLAEISKCIKTIQDLYLNLELYANNNYSLKEIHKYKTKVELRSLNFVTMVELLYLDKEINEYRTSNVELAKKLGHVFNISEFASISLQTFLVDHHYVVEYFGHEFNNFIKDRDLLQNKILEYRKTLN